MSYVVGPAFFAAPAGGGGGTPFDVTIGGNTGNTYTGLDVMGGNSSFPDSSITNPSTIDALGGARFFVFNPTGASNVAGTLSMARLYLYLSSSFGGGKLSTLYDMLRASVLTQMTHNIYSTGNSWATAGALGSGTDRSASSIGSHTAQTGEHGSYIGIDLDLPTMQSKIDAGTNYRVAMFSAEYCEWIGTTGTDGQRPYFRFAGTAP
jgi:hypothetical protein